LGRLPQGVAAEAVHDGPYDRLPVTYNALFQWIDLAGATPVGPVVEEYLSLGSRPAESGPRTRILVPLAPG
jgi:effector-binding domain-containing protein